MAAAAVTPSGALKALRDVQAQPRACQAPYVMCISWNSSGSRWRWTHLAWLWTLAALLVVTSLLALCSACASRGSSFTSGATSDSILSHENSRELAVRTRSIGCSQRQDKVMTAALGHALLNVPAASERSGQVPLLMPKMTCTGSAIATRTCYFEDLLWDVKAQRFVFFTNDTEPHMVSDILFDATQLLPTEPWIKLKRRVTNPPAKKWSEYEFYMDWRSSETSPSAEEVVDAPFPAVHLRTIVNLGSFGHFLRDNLMPLVDVALRFGLDPRDFVWVLCPSDEFGQWSTLKEDLPLLDHYQSWLPSRPGQQQRVLWTDMMARFLGDTGKAEQKYVRFRKLLAGRGSTALDMHVSANPRGNINQLLSSWAHMCAPWPWRNVRALAYGNTGVRMTPAARLKPLVLFAEGHPQEKRRIENVQEIVEQLREELPGVEVQVELISALSGSEQIELLARTTVLVSTIGSRSFRLIYLPDGAQTIIVSPPVWRRPNGMGTFPLPFDETDRCWGFLGYVSVLRHHVLMGPVSERPKSEAGDYVTARDKMVTLDFKHFLPIVQHALHNVRLWEVPDFSRT